MHVTVGLAASGEYKNSRIFPADSRTGYDDRWIRKSREKCSCRAGTLAALRQD